MNQPELVKFNSSECLNEDVWEKKKILLNRIISSRIEDDLHTYKIFVVTNCEWAKEGEVALSNDTLQLKYSGETKVVSSEIIEEKSYSVVNNDTVEVTVTEVIQEVSQMTVAACDCAFELIYQIMGLEKRPYVITANGELIIETPHKYRILYNDPRYDIIENDTINYLDIYGLKQGLHIVEIEEGKSYSKIVYENDIEVSGLISTHYNSGGYDRIEIHMANKKFTKKKYYLGGKLVKECDTLGDFDEGTNCVYFN